MNLLCSVSVLCGFRLTLTAALGFANDAVTISRDVAQPVALTNTPVVVTTTLTNGSSGVIRGFCFSEELPLELAPVTLSVTLNGQAITNYTFEAGQKDDLHAGFTPYRWVLEQPTNFAAANPLPVAANLRITYAIVSADAGEFILPYFDWSGIKSDYSDTVFGYSENSDQQTLRFVTADTPPVISGLRVNNHFRIGLEGVPNFHYTIETSTNLIDWISLTTDTSPFMFTDTNAMERSRRFYRGRTPH